MSTQETLMQLRSQGKLSPVVLEGHWEESVKLAGDAGKALSLLLTDAPALYFQQYAPVHNLPFWVEFWRTAEGLNRTVGLHQVQKMVARHRALLLCLVQAYWREETVNAGGLLAPQQAQKK